jgi:hypothetical protein
VYRDALRQSDPGENGVNGRKPLHVWQCIRDVDSSRDPADMRANDLAMAHQEDGCRIAFANRAELVFCEIGVHPKRIGIDKRDFTLSNIGEVLSLSQEVRHPSIDRGPNLRALGTYQQTLSGVSSHVTVAQPLIFFNLPHGYYLRSSAAMTFDTGNHTSAIPVGLGLGKAIQLDGGYKLNIYAEAQPLLYR